MLLSEECAGQTAILCKSRDSTVNTNAITQQQSRNAAVGSVDGRLTCRRSNGHALSSPTDSAFGCTATP